MILYLGEAVELTLFPRHMANDATEGRARHSSRLQPSINLHVSVTAFMFRCAALVLMYYPEGMMVWVSPMQLIKPVSFNIGNCDNFVTKQTWGIIYPTSGR